MKSLKNYGQKKLSEIDLNQATKKQFEELIISLKSELQKIEAVNALILFGSFARGDYSFRHSDLDLMLFLDKTEKDGKLEEELRKKILQLSLEKKINVHTLFQYKKIEEEDRSLMLTIGREGLVILARKSLVISNNLLGLKECYLIKFDTSGINPVSKNKLQRFLYGYKVKGKKYLGAVDGEKIIPAGKGAILVSGELVQKILLFSQQIGIKAVQKGRFYR
ncbi:MAG: nucleotidyltransferase domain-containing protein [Nanoarchaeota archaeon]